MCTPSSTLRSKTADGYELIAGFQEPPSGVVHPGAEPSDDRKAKNSRNGSPLPPVLKSKQKMGRSEESDSDDDTSYSEDSLSPSLPETGLASRQSDDSIDFSQVIRSSEKPSLSPRDIGKTSKSRVREKVEVATIWKIDAVGHSAVAGTLFAAVDSGDASAVRNFLARGYPVHLTDAHGKTPLMLAAQHGYLEIMEILYAEGAQIDCADTEGFTALMLAGKRNHIDVVRKLVQWRASVAEVNNKNADALMVAAGAGSEDVVEYLLGLTAPGNADLRRNLSPLRSRKNDLYLGIISQITRHGQLMARCDESGRTALMIAIENGHTRIVQKLLAAQTQLTECLHLISAAHALHLFALTLIEEGKMSLKFDGRSELWSIRIEKPRKLHPSLMNTSYFRDERMRVHATLKACHALEDWIGGNSANNLAVPSTDASGFNSMMIPAGADSEIFRQPDGLFPPTCQTPDEARRHKSTYTAMATVAKKAFRDALDGIVAPSKILNHQDSMLNSALMLACRQGLSEVVAMLIALNAKMDSTDAEGNTAMMLAAQEGHIDVIKELIDTAVRNKLPLILVATDKLAFYAGKGDKSAVQTLIAAGAIINHADVNGQTALEAAVFHDQPTIVRLLLRHLREKRNVSENVSENIRLPARNESLLMIAAGQQLFSMVRMLIADDSIPLPSTVTKQTH